MCCTRDGLRARHARARVSGKVRVVVPVAAFRPLSTPEPPRPWKQPPQNPNTLPIPKCKNLSTFYGFS